MTEGGPSAVQWRLSAFSGQGYDKGRSKWVQAMWLTAQGFLMNWWFPPKLRVAVLRRFGATIGQRVLIRHRVRIHWPWKFTVGDDSWIGEGTWILNLEPVTIGSDVCISQDVLLCTGSHNRQSPSFEFDNAPIAIGDGAWLGARATVLRGVTVGGGAVVGSCGLIVRDVGPGELALAPTARSISP